MFQAAFAQVSADYSKVILPRSAISAQELAVVVNDNDPLSQRIARYYAARRKIPDENLIHVRLPTDRIWISHAEAIELRKTLGRLAPAGIQAYAMTWLKPYVVECMSITTAVTFGFDESYCAEGCKTTRASVYFDSASSQPMQDLQIRPSMMLAAETFEAAKALIDRGVNADAAWPNGSAYLLKTSDKFRNVRQGYYPAVQKALGSVIHTEIIESDALENRRDILFYFTGVERVAKLETNQFVDGAVGEHLTSSGGILIDSPQMSIMRWIDAGATASYGAVKEPCNYPAKFANPGVLMSHYLGGETLIEAYWKSVSMPGQGIFVGEPLAAPFSGVRLTRMGADLIIRTYALRMGRYVVEAAQTADGPFVPVGHLTLNGYGLREIRVAAAAARFYRISAEASPAAPG